MTKDKIWIPLLIITIVLLCIDLYAMVWGHWPQRSISLVGIACFICTGATILFKHLRW